MIGTKHEMRGTGYTLTILDVTNTKHGQVVVFECDANPGVPVASTLREFEENATPLEPEDCPKCKGTGRVPGALGYGATWPCDCLAKN